MCVFVVEYTQNGLAQTDAYGTRCHAMLCKVNVVFQTRLYGCNIMCIVTTPSNQHIADKDWRGFKSPGLPIVCVCVSYLSSRQECISIYND